MTFHRLSYKNVGCTSTYVVAEVHSLMRQGSSVAAPKASRFIKLPQRPMACPMKRPCTQQSASAQNESFWQRLKIYAVKKPAMTPP